LGRSRLAALGLVLSGVALPAWVAGNPTPTLSWPSLAAQLTAAHAPAGSPLAKLIAANQDFSLLRPDEARDRRGLPPWLRVYWRKGHPEGRYTAADPTGGYPLVLKEVLEWMESHPDLVPPAAPAASSGAPARAARAASAGP